MNNKSNENRYQQSISFHTRIYILTLEYHYNGFSEAVFFRIAKLFDLPHFISF